VLAATYLQYVSLDLRQTAWHLDLFEQPEEKWVFLEPARTGSTVRRFGSSMDPGSVELPNC
jgi:hypothetical protein